MILVNNYVEKHKQWRKNCFDKNLTQEVEQLKKQIKEKWNAGIYWPETTLQGMTDYWMATTPPYTAVEDARGGGTMILPLEEDGLKLGKMIFASFKDNGLIYCPAHKIPIIIDPAILTVKDEKTVKDAVWDIVKVEIEEYMKIIKGRKFAVPAKEPEELAPVLRFKDETFEKYLRWYDFKKAGLSFRLIALIQFRSKPEDREQKFKEHIGRKKKFRNVGPEKGESTIREGFNVIYRAINRESAPTQEDLIPTSGEFNCPDHGRDCPEGCAYLDDWYANFDNRNKMPYLKDWLPGSRFEPFE